MAKMLIISEKSKIKNIKKTLDKIQFFRYNNYRQFKKDNIDIINPTTYLYLIDDNNCLCCKQQYQLDKTYYDNRR